MTALQQHHFFLIPPFVPGVVPDRIYHVKPPPVHLRIEVASCLQMQQVDFVYPYDTRTQRA